MSTQHNTPVRTTCRTTCEFKEDLTTAAVIMAERVQELLKAKTHEAQVSAFVLKQRAERIARYIDRTKLEGM